MRVGGRLRQVKEVWEVPRDLLLRRYPPFVTGGDLPRGQVPVFVFHSLEPDSFSRKLRHLVDNGYVTLGVDEYVRILRGEQEAPERSVVLTFDDGRGSLWTIGGPLLKRFGLRGVVFLVPGRVRSRPGPLAPTLDDVEAGRATADAIRERERGDAAFLSWEEIDALASSEIFEFQSHTLTHARIHVEPRIVDFLTPPLRDGYAAMDVPLIADDGRDLLAGDAPLGTPLLRSAPRTSEHRRFREDDRLRQALTALVAAEGGETFFTAPDWRRRLRRALRGQPVVGRLETAEEQVSAIRSELVDAKDVLEERLGRPVVHLCYPWHVGGPTARRLAREAGYQTAFCGKVKGVPLTLPGGDLTAIARIGEDYVDLLPGRGRARLAQVLRRKWSRRLVGA